ncbi:hypothetical protein TSACC_22972 [Terrimicrobium sacchariphilum]|uniref:Transmembrane protein n=1 Tax=Terrimicrobium sacchariphilum TaxID=690879 RepID=A0A146GCZ0_TERSA|nr:hypothetical protein [Terrimicrobium sacchariphilum]GAT34547.1 hypothetical protein TSACC_22972 [Terrimicrobium sacchariphilum]
MRITSFYPPPFWVSGVLVTLFIVVFCFSFRSRREPLTTTLLAVLALFGPLLSMGWLVWLLHDIHGGWPSYPDIREVYPLHKALAEWTFATSAVMGLAIIIRCIVIALQQPRPGSKDL